MLQLILVSNSTKKYAEEWKRKDDRWGNEIKVVTSYPEEPENNIYSEIIAIGGGKVIDYGKLISGNIPIIAIPTNGSGASRTSRAVVWDIEWKVIREIKTAKPFNIIKEDYFKTLSGVALEESKADILSHLIEAYLSKKKDENIERYVELGLDLLRKNDIINSSLIAGDCIEITGTNIIHSLSYYLSISKNISHGHSVYVILRRLLPYLRIFLPDIVEDIMTRIRLEDIELSGIDTDLITNYGLRYEKIHSSIIPINHKIVKRMLEGL